MLCFHIFLGGNEGKWEESRKERKKVLVRKNKVDFSNFLSNVGGKGKKGNERIKKIRKIKYIYKVTYIPINHYKINKDI